MATTAPQPLSRPARRPRRRSTDPFGGGIPMALVALATTGIGFWRSFFSRLGDVPLDHMVHGMTSTGWLVLVLVQGLLIRSHRVRWHRILGWSSVVLFAAMYVTSWQMVVQMLSPGNNLPFETAKIFAFSDVVNFPLMLILYGGAILLRKSPDLHSRLISATVLVTIIPAVARMFNLVIPGMDGLILSMHPTYVFILAILGIAIYVDWSRERLRWPFPLVFVWVAITYAAIFPAWKSDWFDAVCRAIAGTA